MRETCLNETGEKESMEASLAGIMKKHEGFFFFSRRKTFPYNDK